MSCSEIFAVKTRFLIIIGFAEKISSSRSIFEGDEGLLLSLSFIGIKESSIAHCPAESTVRSSVAGKINPETGIAIFQLYKPATTLL